MNASVSDAGKYRCILASSDDKNKEQFGFDLRVYKRTSFGDTPSQVTLAVGKPGTLTCRVEFDEKVVSREVSWLRNDRPIDMLNDTSYEVRQEEGNNVIKSQLVISPVDRRHDGQYTCSASALTADLSKIHEHNMHLETNYAPVFDSESHTVWVEKSLGPQQGKQVAVGPGLAQAGTHPSGSRSRSRHGKPHYPTAIGHVPTYGEPTGEANASLAAMAGLPPSSIRVELKCVCQANPPASIIWNRPSENYVLEKNSSPDIYDKIDMPTDGHTTISTLIINYSFEPDYQFKNEKYICKASNTQGKAEKTFKIEQGDPPPALQVADIKHDSSTGSKLALGWIAPASSPDPNMKSVADIVPPIDKLRVRIDNEDVQSFKMRNNNYGHGNSNPTSNTQAVEVPVSRTRAGSLSSGLEFPRNLTIDISKLPTGKQRLYLEAHNPVGWSSNGTYLGEFNIVSGASQLSHSSIISLLLLLLPLTLIYLIQLERTRS